MPARQARHGKHPQRTSIRLTSVHAVSRGNTFDAIPVIAPNGPTQRISRMRSGLRTGGCSFAEDPTLDARHACPVWLSGATAPYRVEKLARPDGAPHFNIWSIPGRKQLFLDQDSLTLIASEGSHELEIRIGDDLSPDDAFEVFARLRGDARANQASADSPVQWIAGTPPRAKAVASTRASTLHLRALQALDGAQAGASQRGIASAVFGEEATRARWSSDGELRAQTRHLLRRAKEFMQGGYRSLASLPPTLGDDSAP